MNNKLTEWNDLKNKCLNCRLCAISARRKNVVLGKGSVTAKILFVGEAPGATEDEEGLPFVGKAGALLTHYLEYFDFTHDKIYITNILKCRPDNNRDPEEEEKDNCIGYLREQTALINPQIIVSLGRIAAQRIIKPDFKITSEHGKWFKKGKIMMTAVYHPSALLRDITKRAPTFTDFKDIQKKYNELL